MTPVRILPRMALAGGPGYADVTTHGDLYRPLSPMLLGPVPLYGGMWSRNMENAWQYAKVYPQFAGANIGLYFRWAQTGWDSQRAERYPLGKGARPVHSLWAGDELDYIAARRRIYIPLYAQAVRMHELYLFHALREQAYAGSGLVIGDFDAYDHRALGYSWDDVINDPERKMGHGFVLAMMIEGVL